MKTKSPIRGVQTALPLQIPETAQETPRAVAGDRVWLVGEARSLYEIIDLDDSLARIRCIATGKKRTLPINQIRFAPEQKTGDSVCSGANETLTNTAIQRFAPEQKTTAPEQLRHWVETYSPSKRPGYSYYRYVWMDGRKLRHRHIKGGDIHSTSAIALRDEVESAIRGGSTPQEIEQLIKSSMRSPG